MNFGQLMAPQSSTKGKSSSDVTQFSIQQTVCAFRRRTLIKTWTREARKGVSLFRALATLLEDLSSIPGAYKASHNCL